MNKFKIAGEYILSFIVGGLVISNLFCVMAGISSLIVTQTMAFKDPIFTNILKYIYIVLMWIMFLAGSILGIYYYRRKGLFFSVFKIDKPRMICNLFISVSISVFLMFISYLANWTLFIKWIIVLFVLSYPFSAILVYIFMNGSKRLSKAPLVLVLVMINPLFVMFFTVLNTNVLNNSIHTDQCGVIITGVADYSSLKDQDIYLKRIIRINGISIDSLEEYRNFMSMVNSNDTLEVNIDNTIHNVRPLYLKDKEIYSLGLWLTYDSCDDT